MLPLLKVPLLKPIVSVTAAIALAVVAMEPTVKVALIGLSGNILVVVIGWILRGKLSDIHFLINSRMTELLAATKLAAVAQGQKEGSDSAKAEQAIKEQGITQGKQEAGKGDSK